ncbi:MAG: prephenate dehydratase [Candidatus Omnitrophica bacterium]|nr:prephenate dehydratase [Candidatus Omnitrophota bacterium]
MKNLKKLRKKIDQIDNNIIRLLTDRAEVSLEIGSLKAKSARPTFSPDREKQVYERLTAANKGPLSNDMIKAIYREVMSGSLALEKPLKIAYLGPEATFTHIAALKKFGSSVNYLRAGSITEVFTEVERGRADYGVVPIENSTEGAVNHTLDMFTESDLKIYSEVLLPIEHNLLAKGKISSIKRIYSNPQVLGQCRIWLETNLPKVDLIPVTSTTKAAQLAAKGVSSAAIASRLAADRYDLKIIAESIEDSPHNITRFLVIAKAEAGPTGGDKTSIMLSSKDRVGVLHDMLVPFKKNRVNLTKIESRPSKKKAWRYYFFIDMQGHIKEKRLERALKQVKKHCAYFKFLGSYPAA